VSASKNQSDETQKPLIIPEFFDFQKEVEDFIPSLKEPIISTTTSTPSSSTDSLLYLKPGILAERDYDFYDDDPIEPRDSDTAGSSVRAGFYPQHANKRNSDDYDYDYDVE
jgi:hypothetical protein